MSDPTPRDYIFDDPRIKIPYGPGDMVTMEVRELADLKAKEMFFFRIVERLDTAIRVMSIPISAGDEKDEVVIAALAAAAARADAAERKLAEIAALAAKRSGSGGVNAARMRKIEVIAEGE